MHWFALQDPSIIIFMNWKIKSTLHKTNGLQIIENNYNKDNYGVYCVTYDVIISLSVIVFLSLSIVHPM